MLIVGFVYGFQRQKTLTVEEKKFRIQEADGKVAMAPRLAREKAAAGAGKLFYSHLELSSFNFLKFV